MPDPTDAPAAAPAAAPEVAPVAASAAEPPPSAAVSAPEVVAATEPAPLAAEAVPADITTALAADIAPEPVAAETEKLAETAETPENPEQSAELAETKPGEPFKYEAWKLPEGAELPPDVQAAATNLFGKYGLTQEASQELVDFHFAQMKRQSEALEQRQRDVWAETNRKWRADVDREFGNRRNTVIGDAKHAIAEAIPKEADRGALWDVLSLTGAGNHPVVIRTLAALGRKLRERGAPQPGRPASQPVSAAHRRYAPRS